MLESKWSRELRNAWQCSLPVDNAVIKRARRKPKDVSDVRWRMELRRRAREDYYSQAGEFV